MIQNQRLPLHQIGGQRTSHQLDIGSITSDVDLFYFELIDALKAVSGAFQRKIGR